MAAVYGYSRVSTQNQANDGESLDVQDRQIRGWCSMQGLELTEVFTEKGISGSTKIAERPEGSIMWSKLKAGDTIIASKLDRMFRSALDALQAVDELKARGVHLVLLDLGGDISSNGLSKLFLTIAAAFAEAERDRIRERVSQTKADQKARGRYLGGKIPFGYTVEDGALVGKPDEQAIIEAVRSMKTEGKVLRLIQTTVEAEHGRKLSLATLAKIEKASEA